MSRICTQESMLLMQTVWSMGIVQGPSKKKYCKKFQDTVNG